MKTYTAEEIHALVDPFIGDLHAVGEIGIRALTHKVPTNATVIVDEGGDDVAFVGHRIDARLMAAAPKLARQLLELLEATR